MIKVNCNIDALFRDIRENRLPLFIKAVTDALDLTCLDTVTEAKLLDTYKDQSNNLRSSIGYVIYNNGEHVTDFFQAAGTGTDGDGSHGLLVGKKVAEETAALFPTGIVAVIVAGENYALWVEARGYDVITGPSAKLNDRLRENMRIIRETAGQ